MSLSQQNASTSVSLCTQPGFSSQSHRQGIVSKLNYSISVCIWITLPEACQHSISK